jgi:hypothetical protein
MFFFLADIYYYFCYSFVSDPDVFSPITFIGKCSTVYSMYNNFIYWNSLINNNSVPKIITDSVLSFSIIAIFLDALIASSLLFWIFIDFKLEDYEGTRRVRNYINLIGGTICLFIRDLPLLILNIKVSFLIHNMTLVFFIQNIIGHIVTILFSFIWKISCFFMINYASKLQTYEARFIICCITIYKVEDKISCNSIADGYLQESRSNTYSEHVDIYILKECFYCLLNILAQFNPYYIFNNLIFGTKYDGIYDYRENILLKYCSCNYIYNIFNNFPCKRNKEQQNEVKMNVDISVSVIC